MGYDNPGLAGLVLSLLFGSTVPGYLPVVGVAAAVIASFAIWRAVKKNRSTGS